MPDPPPVMIATGVGCDVTVSLWRIVRDSDAEMAYSRQPKKEAVSTSWLMRPALKVRPLARLVRWISAGE